MWYKTVQQVAGWFAIIVAIWQSVSSDPLIPGSIKLAQSLAVSLPANFSIFNVVLLLVGLLLLFWETPTVRRIRSRIPFLNNGMLPSEGFYFRGQTIRLTDMAIDNPPVLRNRTFEDFVLTGPAVIVAFGVGFFHDSTFDAPADSLVWAIPNPANVIGAIGLKDCVFRRCTFRGVRIGTRQEFVEQLRKDLSPPS